MEDMMKGGRWFGEDEKKKRSRGVRRRNWNPVAKAELNTIHPFCATPRPIQPPRDGKPTHWSSERTAGPQP
jgi:hypothetical protein